MIHQHEITVFFRCFWWKKCPGPSSWQQKKPVTGARARGEMALRKQSTVAEKLKSEATAKARMAVENGPLKSLIFLWTKGDIMIFQEYFYIYIYIFYSYVSLLEAIDCMEKCWKSSSPLLFSIVIFHWETHCFMGTSWGNDKMKVSKFYDWMLRGIMGASWEAIGFVFWDNVGKKWLKPPPSSFFTIYVWCFRCLRCTGIAILLFWNVDSDNHVLEVVIYNCSWSRPTVLIPNSLWLSNNPRVATNPFRSPYDHKLCSPVPATLDTPNDTFLRNLRRCHLRHVGDAKKTPRIIQDPMKTWDSASYFPQSFT